MSVAESWAPMGGWGPEPLKRSVTGLSLLINCYLGNDLLSRKRSVFMGIRLLFNKRKIEKQQMNSLAMVLRL